jgi:deoxyadenosine/deoxycytidine kinase
MGRNFSEQKDAFIFQEAYEHPSLARVFERQKREIPQIPRIPERRFPIIAIVGPPGGGKTEAARAIVRRFGGEAIFERYIENPYLAASYDRDDPEVAFLSQEAFLILKFENYQRALLLSETKPVVIEPSIETDSFYARVFWELGKMTTARYEDYLETWAALSPYLYKPDFIVSATPSREVLDARVLRRGRDFEQVGFTSLFRDRMIELCREEERRWRDKCVNVGDLHFVGFDGEHGRAVLTGRFGVRVGELFADLPRDVFGSEIVCPPDWLRFTSGAVFAENCVFKRR